MQELGGTRKVALPGNRPEGMQMTIIDSVYEDWFFFHERFILKDLFYRITSQSETVGRLKL
jgi:hypothetical protein